jgi:hypothetical protein
VPATLAFGRLNGHHRGLMSIALFLFRPRSRHFKVLDRQFEVPILDLTPLLREAERRRRRVHEPGFDKLLDHFRSREGRITQAFRRAHEALDAQDAVIYAAMGHVDAYGGALGEAAAFIGTQSRSKLRQLSTQAADRRRLTENARLGARGDAALAQDLALVSHHMRHVARTAALCLSRLARYRQFVDRCHDSLAQREASLAQLRAELVHDEQTWRWRERLDNDPGLALWSTHADAICGDIESMLTGLHKDLAGIEQQLHDIPVTFARLIEGEPPALEDGLEQQMPAMLPGLGDLPMRLDDQDFDAIEAQHIESELILDSADIGELRSRAEDWLARFEHAMQDQRATPPCAACGTPVISAATRGRAHLLCSNCRSTHPLMAPPATNPGLEAVRVGSLLVARTPVTREAFDVVMGRVPERLPNDEAAAPITRVTWLEAVLFCNELSRRQGLDEAYRVSGRRVKLRSDSKGWRLPTLAEWRQLCITDHQPDWWRSPDTFAWHADNARGRIHPVGRKKANPNMLFDVLGNVAEWLWEAPTPTRGGRAASGFGADERLAAGGGYQTKPEDLNPDLTLQLVVEARDDAVGFRPVRDVPPPAPAPGPTPARTPKPAKAAKTPARPKAQLGARPSSSSGRTAAGVFGATVSFAITGVVAWHVLGLHDPGTSPYVDDLPPAAPATPAATSDTPIPVAPPTTSATPPATATPAAPLPDPTPPRPAAPDPDLRKRSETSLQRILQARTGKNRSQTLKSLRELVARDPDFPAAHVELARELARMGRISEATRALEPLLTLGNDADAATAATILANIGNERDFKRIRMPEAAP